jgi:hypothetical protein
MDESGTYRVLAVPMPPSSSPTDALDQLTRFLQGLSRSPSGRRALRRLATAGIDVGQATTLEGLVERYHADSTSRDGTSRQMLDGLLALAPTDPDAALCALVALRPALRWVVRRVYGPHPTEDEVAEVVALAWAAICDGPPRHGTQSRRVVLVTRNRARTLQRRRAARDARERELDGGGPIAWIGPSERDEPVLEGAVRAGYLGRDEAELIALTRGIGIPLEVLAIDHGCTRRTLARRRQRAEASLRSWIRSELRAP